MSECGNAEDPSSLQTRKSAGDGSMHSARVSAILVNHIWLNKHLAYQKYIVNDHDRFLNSDFINLT